MADQENKALALRVVDAFHRWDLNQLDELFTGDYIEHPVQPGQANGPEAIRQRWRMLRIAFPDAILRLRT